MKQKIPFLAQKKLGRYLQSLDSVRFKESDKYMSESQAKIDVFVSLMFGRTITIGEHQFLDSFGLLNNAFDLLKAFQSLTPFDRDQVKHIFPFQLYFRNNYKTLNGLIAEKLGDPKYELSLWNGISSLEEDEMIQRRAEIRKKILDNRFKYEYDNLIPDDDYDAAMKLHAVHDKFEQGEQNQLFTLYGENSVDFTSYNGLLTKGIETICSWSESDLDFQLKRQKEIEKNGYEITRILKPSLISHTLKLINMLKTLTLKGLQDNNRSNIRIGNVIENNKDTLIKFKNFVDDKFIYEGILEIYDSLYNSSIAKASFAHSESVSSARDFSENPYIIAANSLVTMVKNEITDQAEIEGKYFNPPWIQDTNLLADSCILNKKMLLSMPWENVWHAYLDKNWRDSVSNLNNILIKWDNLINNPTTKEQEYVNTENKLNEAYEKHVENISNILKKSGWDFLKEQKNIKLAFTILPEVGSVAAERIASYIIGNVTLDLFWEETLPSILPATIGAGTAVELEYVKESIGRLLSKGYIRKTFARIIDKKDL